MTKSITLRLDQEKWKAASRQMIDDDLSWQSLLESAVDAYVAGEWAPVAPREEM